MNNTNIINKCKGWNLRACDSQCESLTAFLRKRFYLFVFLTGNSCCRRRSEPCTSALVKRGRDPIPSTSISCSRLVCSALIKYGPNWENRSLQGPISAKINHLKRGRDPIPNQPAPSAQGWCKNLQCCGCQKFFTPEREGRIPLVFQRNANLV